MEKWLNSHSPFENESGRVLVKYMSKLRISNKVVLEWVTQKGAAAVYHKCGEILLQYIVDNWALKQEEEEKEHDTKMEGVVSGQVAAAAKNVSLIEEDERQDDGNLASPEPLYSCLGEFLVASI